MVITGISIQNFKGFGEEQKIEFKPITLLFGPNSSGKSTIIQALQYFGEILIRGNVDADKTLWGGDAISLGGFKNLVYMKNKLEREITLKIDFDFASTDIPEYIFPYISDDESDPNDILDEFFPGNFETGWIEIEVAWSEIENQPYLKTYEIGYGKKILGIIDSSPDKKNVQISFLNFNHPMFSGTSDQTLSPDQGLSDLDENEIDEISKFTLFIQEAIKPVCFIKGNAFPVKTKYNPLVAIYSSFKSQNLPQSFESFLNEHTDIPGLISKQNNLDALEAAGNQVSLRLQQSSPMPNSGNLLDFRSDDAGGNSLQGENRALTRKMLSFLFSSPVELLKDAFMPLSYIGPLRKIPDRTYANCKSNPSEIKDWSDGLEAYEILLKSDKETFSKINSWLDKKRLDLSYKLSLETTIEMPVEVKNHLHSASQIDPEYSIIAEDVVGYCEDLQATADEAPEYTRISILDEKKRITVALSEIGVGVSQVLPIVIACIYMKQTAISPHCPYSLLIFEQPELHLHPKLECALGDLFISTVNDPMEQVVDPQFLIETHSEHLMLRFLRRIRETSEGKLEPGIIGLQTDDVAVYYVDQETKDNQESHIKISHLRIDETGEFIDRWPKGFFAEREGELF